MKFTVSDKSKCKKFCSLFQLSAAICEDVNINISGDRLFIQGMDAAHVCLYELTLNNDWFESFEMGKKEKSLVFGVKLKIFSKVLNCWKDDQTITIDNVKQDKWRIQFSSDSIEKTFEMCLFDFDHETLEIPEVDYDVDTTLKSNLIQELVSEMGEFGEIVEIKCSDENIHFTTKQNISETQVENKLNVDELESYSIVEEGSVCSEYSLQYLQNIVQFSRVSKEVEMNISNDYPLRFTYSLGDNNKICLWVSPRME